MARQLSGVIAELRSKFTPAVVDRRKPAHRKVQKEAFFTNHEVVPDDLAEPIAPTATQDPSDLESLLDPKVELDVRVEIVDRPCRVAPLPELTTVVPEMPRHAQQCVTTLTQQHTIVHIPDLNLADLCAPEVDIPRIKATCQFEIDEQVRADRASLQTDDGGEAEAQAEQTQIHPSFVQGLNTIEINSTKLDLSRDRLGVMTMHDPRFVPPSHPRTITSFGTLSLIHREPRVLVDFESLHVGASVEPYLIIAALYDTRRKLKVSEDVVVDLNDSEVFEKYLNNRLPPNKQASPSTLARKFIFSLPDMTSGIFLVLRVERVLSDKVDDAFSPKDLNPAERQKLIEKTDQYLCRLPAYHWQPLMFTAVQLFNDKGELRQRVESCEIKSWWKQKDVLHDSQVIDAIVDVVSPQPSKNKPAPNVEALIRISMLEPEEELDQSRASVAPPSLSVGSRINPSIPSDAAQLSSTDSPPAQRRPTIKRPLPPVPSLPIEPKTGDSDTPPPVAAPVPAPTQLSLALSRIAPKDFEEQSTPYTLDHQHQPLLHQSVSPPSPSQLSHRNIACEVLAFESAPSAVDCWGLTNILYVYPHEVVGKLEGRNVTVGVKLMDSDADISAPGLDCIYARPRSPERFENVGYSHVTYHDASPRFGTEIKIQLPAVLTNRHHLVFTFTHIDCAVKDKSKRKNLLGYAVFPLFWNGQLQHGDQVTAGWNGLLSHSVGILDEGSVGPHYLTRSSANSETSQLKRRSIAPGSNVFSFRTRNVSSIYPSDAALVNFFNEPYPLLTGKSADPTAIHRMPQLVTGLSSVRSPAITQYLPMVLNKLLIVICSPPPPPHLTTLPTVAFGTFLQVLNNVQREMISEESTTKLLGTWVKYFWDVTCNGELMDAHTALCTVWVAYEREQNEIYDYSLRFSGILFEMILKSLALHLNSKNALNQHDPEVVSNALTPEFVQALSLLVRRLACDIVQRNNRRLLVLRNANRCLSRFIRALFCLLPRAMVLGLLSEYSKQMYAVDTLQSSEQAAILDFKLHFLDIILSDVTYVQLIDPKPIPEDIDIATYLATHHEMFLLPGLLLGPVREFDKLSKQSRTNLVASIRHHLLCFDADKRYASDAARSIVFSAYFPFVPEFVRHFDVFYDLQEDPRDALIVFLALVKQAQFLLKKWLDTADMSVTNQFFEVLGFCTDAFAYNGQRVVVSAEKLRQTTSLHESSLNLILQTDPDDANIGLTPRGSVIHPLSARAPSSGLAALESHYVQVQYTK